MSALNPDYEKYLTVTFEGRARDIKGNPFDVKSDFGRPITISLGDMISERERFEEALNQIVDLDDYSEATRIAKEALGITFRLKEPSDAR